MGSIVSYYSYTLSIFESISQWVTCTALVCCIVITITLVLCLGIGLGYNYCFVDMMVKSRYARYAHPDSNSWASKENDPYTSQSALRREMFKDVFETERLYDPDIKKHLYNFHSMLVENTTTLDNTNNEIKVHPTRTTLKSYMNNTTETSNNSTVEVNKPMSIEDIATIPNNIILLLEENIVPTRTTLKSAVSATPRASDIDKIEEALKVIHSESVTNGVVDKESNSKKEIPILSTALLSLLAKLRAENKNYTLKIIT